MPFAIAIFAFLILLGFSGGIQGGLAPESTASSTVEQSTNESQVNRSTSRGASNRSTGQFDSSFSLPGEVTGSVLDYRLPSVETLSARNIESQSATVRGSVMLRTYKDGIVYAVYGYNQARVEALAKNFRSTDKIQNDDRAEVLIIDRRANGSKAYERRVSGLVKDTKYFVSVCVEYQTIAGARAVSCGETRSFVTNPAFQVSGSSFRAPRISVKSPLGVTDSEASFQGQVTMNDGIDGIPFFVFGESETLVRSVDQSRTYSGVREDDEDLQKQRIASGLRGQYDFTVPLSGLDNNQIYYYRACVQYDGERDGLVCDSVRSFETDRRDRSNKPTAMTGTVGVSGTRATLRGSADMEDFFDGVAFFVYGTDHARIAAIEEQNAFDRISQSIDRVQRVAVDDDFDGANTFTRTITDLLPQTEYSYRMCVQFIDEDDRGREQFFLRCGTQVYFTSGG